MPVTRVITVVNWNVMPGIWHQPGWDFNATGYANAWNNAKATVP